MIGLVVVFFVQQLGYLDLTNLVSALFYLVVAGAIGGVLGGLFGWALGRRYAKKHPVPPPTETGTAPTGR